MRVLFGGWLGVGVGGGGRGPCPMTGCGVNGVEPATTALVLRRLYKYGVFQIDDDTNTVVKGSGVLPRPARTSM